MKLNPSIRVLSSILTATGFSPACPDYLLSWLKSQWCNFMSHVFLWNVLDVFHLITPQAVRDSNISRLLLFMSNQSWWILPARFNYYAQLSHSGPRGRTKACCDSQLKRLLHELIKSVGGGDSWLWSPQISVSLIASESVQFGTAIAAMAASHKSAIRCYAASIICIETAAAQTVPFHSLYW